MKSVFVGLILISLIVCNAEASSLDTCLSNVAIKAGTNYKVTVEENNSVRQLQPAFFGFNLEWLPFQLSLWDTQRGVVKPEVINLLSNFPGAVYRYPGGTRSNHYDWHDAVGTIGLRPKKQIATWLPPLAVQFGPSEYLKFVHEVGGEAWYVANLYGGSFGEELTAEEVASSAGELATFMLQQQKDGLPHVLRWELGNELDRDRYHWPPQKLAKIARAVSKEISSRDASAHFVTLLEEYPAMSQAGFSASAYNKKLAGDLKPLVDEYAMHLYYDGKPGGPPVKQQLGALCHAVEDARQAGITNPSVWITEHARIPEGAFVTPNWKPLWPETGNLQAAISVSDMMIASAQMPEVKGSILHALHGSDGPWPLLHSMRSGDVYPGVVLLALRMLRESMLPVVLRTRNESANISGYEGGYDVRAVVMTDAERKHYAVWVVNRDGHAIDATLSIPALNKVELKGKLISLSDESAKANNYQNGQRVQPTESLAGFKFDQAGSTTIKLQPFSVTVLSLAATQ